MLSRLVLAATFPLLAAPLAAEESGYRAAYFYKVRWGFQDEFERLFLANHYPVLAAQKESGRIRAVEMYKPTFHGDDRSDWTFLVVITFRDWTAVAERSEEEAVIRRLYPDQDTFKKQEQRRFEILDAHWDVPLTPLAAPSEEKPSPPVKSP
jgi:hypothetical protein